MNIFDVIGTLFSIAGEVKESVSADKLQKTEEFKLEVEAFEKELMGKSDNELLSNFNLEYVDNYVKCELIPPLVGFSSNPYATDPQWHAYRNVFSKRGIVLHSVECPNCEMEDRNVKLGYRYFFASLKNIPVEERNLYRNLPSGECTCWNCSKSYYWRIEKNYYDDNFELVVR